MAYVVHLGVITSVGKLLSAGVGSSVGNASATGLEELSDVDATVNMLHRHVSIKGELWYKNKYFSKERPNIIITNFPILVALSCKLTSYCAIEVGLKCD